MVFSVVKSVSPFDSENQVVIRFVLVDYSEPMDFVVVRLLQDHHVYDAFPSVLNVSGAKSIINKSNAGGNEVRLECGQVLPRW
jgi:hypothetical protein